MIRLIHIEQLRTKIEFHLDGPFGTPAKDSFILAEVGQSNSYDCWHIQNALSLPAVQLPRCAKKFLPNKGLEIVLYGENRDDSAPLLAAEQLTLLGYLNLFIYPGGKQEWKTTGLPIVSSLVPADGLNASEELPSGAKAAA